MRSEKKKTAIAAAADRRIFIIGLFVVAILFLVATWYTKFNPITALLDQGEFWNFIFIDFLPPSFKRWDQLALSALQTFCMAMAPTGISAVLAFLLAFIGSPVLCRIKPLTTIIRAVASVLRNIPALVWAFVLVAAFGIGTAVGVLSLIVYTTGFLIRAYIETLDEVAGENLEALRATGAGTLAVITQALIPAALPGYISWFLYSVETNIRASTILGMVGAGGIGLLMMGYIKQYNYHAASMVILAVAVMIVGINLLTEYLRKLTIQTM